MHYRVHPLPDIPDPTEVWITTDKSKSTPDIVVGKAEAPRSYIVETHAEWRRRQWSAAHNLMAANSMR